MVVSQQDFETFCARQVVPAAVEYRSLINEVDPDVEPFRSRYAAAEGQQRLLQRCDVFEPLADSLQLQMHGSVVTYPTIRGRLLMRHGLALAETDLTAESRESLTQAAACHDKVPASLQDPVGHIGVLNSLGMLLNNTGDYEAALPRLDSARELYDQVKAGAASTACSQSLAQMEREDVDAAHLLENLHTKTLYFLAQVHQNAGNHEEAVKFCAATLQRQAALLGAGEHETDCSLDEWTTNALSLSGVYISRLNFACAERLLHAATAVLALSEKMPKSSLSEETRPALEVAWGRYNMERLNASIEFSQDQLPKDLPTSLPEHLQFSSLNLSRPDELPWGDRAYAKDFAEARRLFNSSVPRLRAALKFYRLDGWVSDHVQLLFDISKAYACVRKPEIEFLYLGSAACQLQCRSIGDWKGVRKFASMIVLNSSCHLFSDSSGSMLRWASNVQACRALTMFEKDPHRATVMHRQRVKLFDNVVGDQLNRKHYDGLVKSIALEVANSMRHIWAIKDNNKWPQIKIEAANCAAADKFEEFLTLFHVQGKLPQQLEEAWEAHVLSACVAEGRLRLQQSGSNKRSRLIQTEGLLRYARDYQQRHHVEEFDDEGILATQMHELVTQQLQMLNT